MNTLMNREQLITEILLRLGYQIVDVELDPEHLNLAVDRAFRKYRQRSENAVEESFEILEIKTNVNMYSLDESIVDVRDVLGRMIGTTAGGNDIEPFEAQYLSTFLLQSGRSGGLAVYDALAQQRELLGRMFGAEYTFTWNRSKHNLMIHRRPKSDTSVYLHCYKYKTEEDLLSDYSSLPWLEDYSLAMAKLMLAEGRGKWSAVPGPQGGATLNGAELKSDAQAELVQLEEDLKMFRDGGAPLGIIIG